MTKLRNFCITSFNTENYDSWKKLDIRAKNINYLVYQLEKSPTTKKLHLQAYIEFINSRASYKSIKQDLGDSELHIEERKGTREQARAYCMKEKSRIKAPIEKGRFMVQGSRSDLNTVYDFIKAGASVEEVMEKFPCVYFKYHRAIEKAVYTFASKKLGTYRDVDVTVLYGGSGTGKTRYVFDKEGTDNVYRLTRGNSGNIWFDGYTGQKVLLIDDYYGWIKYGQLLELLDGYRLRLEVKGSFVVSDWDRVYITSNKPPTTWYTMHNGKLTDALSRRLFQIIKLQNCKKKSIRQPIYRLLVDGDLQAPLVNQKSNGSTVLPPTFGSDPPDSDSSEDDLSDDEFDDGFLKRISVNKLDSDLHLYKRSEEAKPIHHAKQRERMIAIPRETLC